MSEISARDWRESLGLTKGLLAQLHLTPSQFKRLGWSREDLTKVYGYSTLEVAELGL